MHIAHVEGQNVGFEIIINLFRRSRFYRQRLIERRFSPLSNRCPNRAFVYIFKIVEHIVHHIVSEMTKGCPVLWVQCFLFFEDLIVVSHKLGRFLKQRKGFLVDFSFPNFHQKTTPQYLTIFLYIFLFLTLSEFRNKQSKMTDAYIYDAIRTPRGKGKSTGALHEVRAIDLLSDVLKELKHRNKLDTSQVDDGIFGCVTAMDDQGGNIGKASLLFADWHESVGGMQINRFCCSGLEAVNLAAMKIRSGLEDLIVAGGVESMSRVPMHSDDGPMLFDPDVVGKINYLPQGVAADLIATIEGFSREELDAYALQSHQRATYAMQKGYFDKSLVPIRDWVGLVILDKDEHVRPDCSRNGLAALKPAFSKHGEMGFDAMAQKKYPSVPHKIPLSNTH